MDKDYSLRKASSADVEFLLELRMETMEEHLKNANINLTIDNHRERVLHNFESAKIILNKKERIGLLKLLEHETHYEIEQIQIQKKHQGKGIGNKIIKGIIKKAEAKNISIKLSVLKNNKARHLYERLGFKIVSKSDDSYTMIKKTDSIESKKSATSNKS